MALNIKNPEVERIATEVAALARESKTEAIRRALLERKQKLRIHGTSTTRRERLETSLRNHIWPLIPAEYLGRRISKKQREAILGYDPEGV